jgi:hypothetical protein
MTPEHRTDVRRACQGAEEVADVELRWEPPPPPKQGFWWDVAAALRSRPGEWAAVPGKGKSWTNHITQANIRAFAPKGSFDATSRAGQLWVRYIGPTAASPKETR